MTGEEYHTWRLWPLQERKSRRLPPGRFDVDDLLGRTPAEMLEMVTGRIQDLTITTEATRATTNDWLLLALTLLVVTDGKQRASKAA